MLHPPNATTPLAGVGAPFELLVQSVRRSLVFPGVCLEQRDFENDLVSGRDCMTWGGRLRELCVQLACKCLNVAWELQFY